ncbi:MAG: ribose 5-phosphate isomerase B [bacterium]|nr:ribose 5-phosphate isomerase B [bacterium]
MKKIAIGTDHSAVELKSQIIDYLESKGYILSDEGAYTDDSCDYPDYALKVAKKVQKGDAARGILICGTGIGMAIAANKVKGILAAVCTNTLMAEMTRKHNNSNVLCLGVRVSSHRDILEMIDTWLETEYEEGRHRYRLNKISDIENSKL